MKVLVSDKLAQEGIDILKDGTNFTVDCKYGLSPEELKKIIKDYDGLIVRSGTTVTADIIEAADNLKVIGRAGVGLDNVDLTAATKKGIVAMNTPGGNTTSTAEHTMSMILALSRNIPQAYRSLKEGKWERSKFGGVELYGKTLGIIGLGRIGSTVAKFAKAFEMKIIAYDPFLSLEAAKQKGIEVVELETLFKMSDYITIHVPKTDETKDLIGEKEFGLMKSTVRVVNCARGGIINEDALAKALQDEKIAGCALDVFDKEPLDPKSPLLNYEKCVVTPHLGASTSEAQVNVAKEIAETVKNALLGNGISNAANFPSVDAETYKQLEPYNNLAVRMGKFAGQLIGGRISSVNITYCGAVNSYKVAPITLSLVNGLLKPILGDAVNFINALNVAQERSIDIQESKSTHQEEFSSCLKLCVKTDKEEFELWGTLSGNQQPRIVRVNDVYVEAEPVGCLLFIKNEDKPGLVGAVGTILADSNVNIAGISLSREAQDGIAVSIVNIDEEASQDVLTKLENTKGVLEVKQLKV